MWTNVGGPIPTGGRPIYSSSEILNSMIKNNGVVKQIRIADSPTNSDAQGSDKLDSEKGEVVNPSINHHSSNSPFQPSAKGFQSQVIPSTPSNFQPILSTIPPSIPPPSPNPSTARPSLDSPMRPTPIQHPRQSPIFTSQKLQPGQLHKKKRASITLTFYCLSSVSKKRMLACPEELIEIVGR
ncbi:hypothetical protein O181_017343 [Austropuccinia psidii MF-1]|uniref:Uncharacterized protein n=1 Tax=Austropuccinia psidii MF-1 TaxID=1389203 RepID=A0A9Q3C6Y2_9BASI|nr:hypothetical protein [Austropuccinia psidii MF-1]